MNKKKYLTIIAVLLLLNILYGIFVFSPTVNPNKVVDTSNIEKVEEIEKVEVLEEIDIFEKNWQLEIGETKIMDAKILNRALPASWEGKKIFFKYTYIGEYDEEIQKKLDELLATEYRWQNQLDTDGNVIMGGPLLKRDEIYQLHTHNAFSLGEKYFLLGELTVRYSRAGELVGTEIMLGNVKLRAIWEKDTKILEDPTTPPGANLVISTCLELHGDRRLLTGWILVEETI